MTSFGNIQRFLATNASKLSFAFYVCLYDPSNVVMHLFLESRVCSEWQLYYLFTCKTL